MDGTKGNHVASFGIFNFTTEELLSIPDVEQRFILTASLITNDIRFHWSMAVRAKVDGESDDVKKMQYVRDLWILRKLASVVQEAEMVLVNFAEKIELLGKVIESGISICPPSDEHQKHLALARTLRNQTAYHYGVGNLAGNLLNFDPNALHTLYAHEQHGNTVSAICEQVLTIPTISSAFPGANIDRFHQWCLACSSSILNFCNIGIAELIILRLPNKTISMKEILVGDEAATVDHRWPLFLIAKPKSSP